MTMWTQQIRRPVVIAATLLALGSLAVAGGLTPEMMVDLKQIRQVAVAPDGEPRYFAGEGESISNVAWSPDGKGIAFSGTTDIPHEMALGHWNSWWFDEPELHWQQRFLSEKPFPFSLRTVKLPFASQLFGGCARAPSCCP